MIYNVVFISAIHLHELVIGVHMFLPLESPSHLPPPHPTPLVVTEYQAEFPVPHSNISLAVYFTQSNIYISELLSQLGPPSPSPTVSISLFSMSEFLFLPCK